MLGVVAFDELARYGARMESADAVEYAQEQIRRVREELRATPGV